MTGPLRRFVLLLALACAASASAAEQLVWLGPSAAVSPEGFPVGLALRGDDGKLSAPADAQVTIKGGTLKPGSEGLPLRAYVAVPDPGAREVHLSAAKGSLHAEASFQVGPPAARVELSLNPPAPVKGKDKEAELRVRLLKADGSVDPEASPPVVQTNVGTLEAITQVEPGVFRGRYVLPDTGYPEVAVVVAFSPWPSPSSVYGSFAALRVPLATSFQLPGVTEPNAQMTLEIAGQKFGPAQAGPDGRFELAVVVPPGYRFAKGLAVDRAGNRRSSTIDMALPPTDQLACVMNPRTLPADGASRARILCAVSDQYGKPIANAKVAMSVKRGTLQGPRAQGDLLEWIYTAPKPPSLEKDALKATAKQAGPLSVEELSVELVQGPAVKAKVRTDEPLVHRGGNTAVHAEVVDAFGRARGGAVLETKATAGQVTTAREDKPGAFVAEWSVDEKEPAAAATLNARAYGPVGKDPAALLAWEDGGQLVLGVADAIGAPVPAQPITVDGKTVTSGPDGMARVALPAEGSSVDVRHANWPGLSLRVFRVGSRAVFPTFAQLGTPVDSAVIRLGPPLPVNVRVQVKGRDVTYWVEDPKGALLKKRQVEVKLSSGSRSAEDEREGKRHFTVTAEGPVSVSIADALTGVTALTVVRP